MPETLSEYKTITDEGNKEQSSVWVSKHGKWVRRSVREERESISLQVPLVWTVSFCACARRGICAILILIHFLSFMDDSGAVLMFACLNESRRHTTWDN